MRKKTKRIKLHEPYYKLKGALVAAGLNNKKAAEIIGIHPVTFSERINGSSDFTLSDIRKLAEHANFVPCEVLPFLGKYDTEEESIKPKSQERHGNKKRRYYNGSVFNPASGDAVAPSNSDNGITVNRIPIYDIVCPDQKWNESCRKSAIEHLSSIGYEANEENIEGYFTEIKKACECCKGNDVPAIFDINIFPIFTALQKLWDKEVCEV